MRLALAILLKLHELQHFGHARIDFRFRHAVLFQSEGDILLDRHVGEQRIGLEHHVDRALVGRDAAHVLAVQRDAARCRLLEARQHAHQRGLAAARSAKQRKELAIENIERQIIDGGEVAENLRHIFKRNEGLGRRVVPRRKLAAKTAKRFHSVPL